MTQNQVDVAQQKTLLEQRRLGLLRRIDGDADQAINGEDRVSEGREAGDAADASVGVQAEDNRLNDAARATAELREVEDALARIEDGTYGRCVDCDQPIAPARLRALPEAARCVECQRVYDSQHVSGAHHATL